MKKYRVTVPREYVDGQGNKKTHFWTVGVAFPLRETDGFNVELYGTVDSTRFVLFADDDKPTDERERGRDERDRRARR